MAEQETHRLAHPPDDRRCVALNLDGNRCGKWALTGGDRCGKHAAIALVDHGAISGGSAPGPGSGSAKPDEERDRALALKEARRMLKDGTTPAAVKAQLIRTLAGVEEAQSAAKAPGIEALDAMTVPELEALVLAHC